MARRPEVFVRELAPTVPQLCRMGIQYARRATTTKPRHQKVLARLMEAQASVGEDGGAPAFDVSPHVTIVRDENARISWHD